MKSYQLPFSLLSSRVLTAVAISLSCCLLLAISVAQLGILPKPAMAPCFMDVSNSDHNKKRVHASSKVYCVFAKSWLSFLYIYRISFLFYLPLQKSLSILYSTISFLPVLNIFHQITLLFVVFHLWNHLFKFGKTLRIEFLSAVFSVSWSLMEAHHCLCSLDLSLPHPMGITLWEKKKYQEKNGHVVKKRVQRWNH